MRERGSSFVGGRRAARVWLPVLVAVLVLGAWEAAVDILHVPVFVLPAPSAIAEALVVHAGSLGEGLAVTAGLTAAAFGLAVLGGVALAVLFARSRALEDALFPYAVILQVTPVVAIAPLILIWVGLDRAWLAILILAWIVAFFPVLANTTLGLRAVDPNLLALFRLYGASERQILLKLRMPSALPYLFSGMKVAGGLALIGTVVAEFVAGAGSTQGLGWRIVEAGNRLQIPKMFAALALLSALGVAIFFTLTILERRALARWHDSA